MRRTTPVVAQTDGRILGDDVARVLMHEYLYGQEKVFVFLRSMSIFPLRLGLETLCIEKICPWRVSCRRWQLDRRVPA
jgi:hypothetical protein